MTGQDWFATNAPQAQPAVSGDPAYTRRDPETMPGALNYLYGDRNTPPKMGAPTGKEPVTLDDLKEDPVGSIKRIGAAVGREATDPRNWVTLAAMYFGPKVLSAAGPIVARAAGAAKAGVGEIATPSMVKDMATVGLGDARVNAGIRIGGRLSDAVQAARTAAGTAGREAPPVVTGPQPTQSAPSAPIAEPAPSPQGIRMGPEGTLVGRPGGNPEMPDQRALNDARLAERRAEYQARTTGQPQQTPAPAPAAGPLRLTAAESKIAIDLQRRGMPDAEIERSILLQRELAARLGGPLDASVRAAVKDRNASGRWQE